MLIETSVNEPRARGIFQRNRASPFSMSRVARPLLSVAAKIHFQTNLPMACSTRLSTYHLTLCLPQSAPHTASSQRRVIPHASYAQAGNRTSAQWRVIISPGTYFTRKPSVEIHVLFANLCTYHVTPMLLLVPHAGQAAPYASALYPLDCPPGPQLVGPSWF
jgi:hypothetical protein